MSGAGLAALVAVPAAAQVVTKDAAVDPATAPVPPQTSTDAQAPGIGDAKPIDAKPDDVVVTALRKNLESAQERKRNADTFVDSLTADEIGSFPDKSVAEALQRVPGITVSRFAGTGDTSHFSAEPSGVLVRGLPQVRSEFNGRDSFSANSGRGLSYEDVSPELLSGVDVYKNQTAELVEGGIAGTINIRTRLPFESTKQFLSVSAEAIYNDNAKRATPQISAIYSNRFQTGIGEFGVMINGVYSQEKTRVQGIQLDRMGIFNNVFGPGLQYIPSGIFMRDTLYDRKRNGESAAGQWRSNDGHELLTVQYNRTQYDRSWREHSVYSSAYSLFGIPTDYQETSAAVIQPLTFRPAFTFDSQGNFLTGWWSAPTAYLGETPNSSNLIAQNQNGQAFFNKCYAWEGCTAANGFATRRAPQLDAASNAIVNKEVTQDFDADFRWDVSDRLSLRIDGQYVRAKAGNYNGVVNARTFANTFIDLSGSRPTLTIEPTKADNVNLAAGGIINPNNYSYYSASDHTEDSDGTEYALRADADYDLGDGWLDVLRVGGRYADRDQTVRYSAYNWQNIANTWAQNAAYYNIDSPAYPAGNYGVASIPHDFYNGNQLNTNSFVFFNNDKLAHLDQLGAALDRSVTGVGDFNGICSNLGARAGETVTGDFGCYLPSEILKVDERTFAGYAMLKFGGHESRIGGIGLSGNIGARAIWTRDSTQGAFTFAPAFTANELICSSGPIINGRPTVTSGCITSADEIKFNDNSSILNKAQAHDFRVLPSFNMKLDVTSKLIGRFAYSRAISRPDIGLLRNFISVNRISPNLTDPANPAITFGPDGVTPVAYKFRYTAVSGNPRLKPVSADQFDVGAELYFSKSGSLTGGLFYKKFYDYIQNSTYNLTVTNNGVTRDILVRGPSNGKGAKIEGAEVAFHSFFDALPGPLKGLGMEANYTYVHNSGIKSTGLIAENAAGTAGGGVSYDTTAVKPDRLEGVSTHTFNVVGLYEYQRISLRLAYAWRSKYLVTALDCCTGLPIWQNSIGLLDGSIRFRLAPQFEFSLEGSNLLGTDTITKQQVDNAGTLKDYEWLRTDRRIQFGARVTF
ncbi:TonB-dependent receptor [Sphingomonas bacterium]|uniref:TonB-dependent receptor n=1 Tax=Sphingomonas bacterium TaxID=1895847 RepID=UPI001576339F|nr:TonB-dependent receptor [Sphingomonas bacterium]